ncbi:MAG: response regulator [Gemmatimonadaceae bacterium]
MTMRLLIVDDEPLARRALRQLLVDYDDVEVISECSDAIDAAEVLSRREVDVVLLDIRMPQVSGLELAREIKQRPLVVFVTAHEESGAAAFETGAADYLVKPVTASRLRAAMQRVRERLAQLEDSTRYREMISKSGGEYLERLVVRVGNRDVVLSVEDVELFAADDVHVALHVDGRRYEMRTPLDKLNAQLDPARFVRVHRSYIVPVRSVVAVHHKRAGTGSETTIELRNGATIPVSRRRRSELARLEVAALRG